MKFQLNPRKCSKDILHPSTKICLDDDVMCQKLV